MLKGNLVSPQPHACNFLLFDYVQFESLFVKLVRLEGSEEEGFEFGFCLIFDEVLNIIWMMEFHMLNKLCLLPEQFPAPLRLTLYRFLLYR